jgi:Fur family iron response transcriptional regulator
MCGMIEHKEQLKQRLIAAGISPTPQRLAVAGALLEKSQHLTADQVFERVKGEHVSLATVYNTLKLLTERNLLREVVVNPTRVFFDSCTDAHHHFFDAETGELTDIPAEQLGLNQLPRIPAGKELAEVQIVLRLRSAK